MKRNYFVWASKRVIITSNYVPTGCNKCLVYNGFIVFVSSCQDTPSQYGKWRNISVTRLSIRPITLDSWPIRAHLASHNDELCKKLFCKSFLLFQKGATIMYSMWKIMCFLNLKVPLLCHFQYCLSCSV